MYRVAFLVLVLACSNPVEPQPVVTVMVTAQRDSMGTTQGCRGTFVMTSQVDSTHVTVAVLHQDIVVWNTYEVTFSNTYALMAPYFPTAFGYDNAARFIYSAQVPGEPDILPQYIEAPCGTTVTRAH